MKRRGRLIVLLVVFAVGAVTTVGLRPRMTEAEVLRLAEPVLEAEYPRDFSGGRPYRAKFAPMERVWHVRGTVPPGAFGGTPEAKVSDVDGSILEVTATQ